MAETLKLSGGVLEKIPPKLDDLLKQELPKSKRTGKCFSKKTISKEVQKPDSRKALEVFVKKRNKTLMWLCKSYPRCFSIKDPIPLKIGIVIDIYTVIPEAISRAIIRKVLHRYTRTKRYLDALISNPHRYNLDGEQVGEVSDKERKVAQIMIDSFNAPVK